MKPRRRKPLVRAINQRTALAIFAGVQTRDGDVLVGVIRPLTFELALARGLDWSTIVWQALNYGSDSEIIRSDQ